MINFSKRKVLIIDTTLFNIGFSVVVTVFSFSLKLSINLRDGWEEEKKNFKSSQSKKNSLIFCLRPNLSTLIILPKEKREKNLLFKPFDIFLNS